MSNAEELEAAARVWFEPLRSGPSPEPSPDLSEKAIGRVKEWIGAADLIELGTGVLVVEFLGPVLDLLAFALGIEDKDEDNG